MYYNLQVIFKKNRFLQTQIYRSAILMYHWNANTLQDFYTLFNLHKTSQGEGAISVLEFSGQSKP